MGNKAELDPLLLAEGLSGNTRLSVVHASEVITMDDKPIQALKRKKDSSMLRRNRAGLKTMKPASQSAVVIPGALMAGGTLRLRMMNGVDRPALAAVIPRVGGYFVLIDAGANPEARPEHLVHNAVLGANYAKVILGLDAPRVGLITIGTEEGKGNALIAETHDQLKKLDR